MLRAGFVDYLNALPYHIALPPGHFAPHFAIPSKLNALMRAEALDLSLVSSVEALDGSYDLLSGLCIAAQEAILSVNFYRKQKLDHSSRIALTSHSATSVALLKVLCHHFWNVHPQFVPLDETLPYTHYDGILLIGDGALQNLEIKEFQTVDLAAAWFQETTLPFVFALFACQKGLHVNAKPFEVSLEWSRSHFDELVEDAHQKSSLDRELLKRYYHLLHYHLGDKEREGLMLFDTLRKSLHV